MATEHAPPTFLELKWLYGLCVEVFKTHSEHVIITIIIIIINIIIIKSERHDKIIPVV